MEEIIQELQGIGVISILKIENNISFVRFYFDSLCLGEVSYNNQYLTHNNESILKGLQTNYNCRGFYYKIPALVKRYSQENQNLKVG